MSKVRRTQHRPIRRTGGLQPCTRFLSIQSRPTCGAGRSAAAERCSVAAPPGPEMSPKPTRTRPATPEPHARAMHQQMNLMKESPVQRFIRHPKRLLLGATLTLFCLASAESARADSKVYQDMLHSTGL